IFPSGVRIEWAEQKEFAIDIPLNGSYDSTSATPSKTVNELAQEVLDGKWGNGTDRKERLTAAGYDYSAVQAKVNALAKKQESAPVYYTVKSGDTLSGIARKYGTTVSAIQKLNPTLIKKRQPHPDRLEDQSEIEYGCVNNFTDDSAPYI
ncbi:LysM peptidoglycan-binding domain-containing protein, partial [Dialister succinatiphilus]|uniref:LysM peptidoglycan-binding domain-containing protein n=1 Tax=Dialister succinatiphilus TaxID=487173 RepID=UPI0040253FCA